LYFLNELLYITIIVVTIIKSINITIIVIIIIDL